MTSDSEASGSNLDTDVQKFLKLLASNSDTSGFTVEVKKVIDELLKKTDTSVKDLIEQLPQKVGDETETAGNVESLLGLSTDSAEVKPLLIAFQRQLFTKLSSVLTKSEVSVEYKDQNVDAFVKGTMHGKERVTFVGQLKNDPALRKRCILWRENLSELDVSISAVAAKAFNDGISKLWSGNRNYPGHEWNSYGQRANESIFVRARETAYSAAKESFEQLLELGELEDLALANLAIVETNILNAPIAATFYPGAGYDHGDAMVRSVNQGKMSPMEAVFGQGKTPSDSEGNVPPSWREGIPLRMQSDTRPIMELLKLDISNLNCARQLIRRLNEFIPQKRHIFSTFDSLKTLLYEQDLKDLMEKEPELVHGLAEFIEQPLPGGNDNQLSKLNESRQVAYRLLAIRFVQTGDPELLERIKGLFNKGVESFRGEGGGDWETNWFYEGPEIIIHYADGNDALWEIITEVIEEASKTGIKEYFVNSLYLFKFTESMAKLNSRFSRDASARQLVEDRLIKCNVRNGPGEGVCILKAFPEAERVPACLRCLDGTNEQDDSGRGTALHLLQEIDGERLAQIDPKIALTLSDLVEKEVALRFEESKNNESKDWFTRNRNQESQAAMLMKMSMLVYSLDKSLGEKCLGQILDNLIVTGTCVKTEMLVVLAGFCRKNSIATTRSQFVTLYPYNIHSDANECHTRDFLALLREWNVTDSELAAAFMTAASTEQTGNSGYYREGIVGGAYDQLVKSFAEEEEVTGYSGEEYQGINNGKNPQAWAEIVQKEADAGNEKFVELLLQEPYRHLLTPERVQSIVDTYVQRTLGEGRSSCEVHDDTTANSYHEALAACAHLPDARKNLLTSIENEIRKFDSAEAIAENEKNPRLLHFLMQLHTKAMAVGINERDGDLNPQIRSWLFFSREFQPPAEVSQLLFDYCLNNKTRASVDVSSSFDNYDQMEAIGYVDNIFSTVGSSEDENAMDDAPISLHDLETYVNNLVNGRKIPAAALQAAYAFQLPYIQWGKSSKNSRSSKPTSEILKLMKYPILGITSGRMNHRGPLMQALSSRFSKLCSHISNWDSLEFGQEEGTDSDLEVTFFLSAAFRLRKYEAVSVLRNNKLNEKDLYIKVARFASMGAAEAEEDQDYQVALEMLNVLKEVVKLVPEGLALEGLSKTDFSLTISRKIEQICAKVDVARAERVDQKIKENPKFADQLIEGVRSKIALIREGVNLKDAQDYSMHEISMKLQEEQERKMMHNNPRGMMRMHDGYHQLSEYDRERFKKVREYNDAVRTMRRSLNAKIINGKAPPEGGGFGGWYIQDMGHEACQAIGERVCKEMHFTIDELKQ